MGLIIGNRALQGSPMLPYRGQSQYAAQDWFLPMVFLDRQRVPVVPTSIQIELDDLTNSITMYGPTTLTSTGATSGSAIYPAFASGSPTPWLLQLAGSIMQMTFPYEGSQITKLKVVFTALDSVTGNAFTDVGENILELVASPTVSGTL
jgi:hypothetical protein